MRGISSRLHVIVLPEFRQKIYFRNLDWIGGTGSRRQTPYVCEYSGVLPLAAPFVAPDLRDHEVGYSSTTSSTPLLDVKLLRSTRGMLPEPSRYRITNR